MTRPRSAILLLVTCLTTGLCEEPQDIEWPSPGSMTQGEAWPLPQKFEYGRENRTIRRGSLILSWQGLRDVDCDILEFAKRTYQKEWFFPNRNNQPAPNSLKLTIRTDAKCPEKDEYPQQGMNEEYYLRVPAAGDAILEADEVWGIVRGLETFSQLIFQVKGSYYVRTATIHDWPEYTVRGILIDTSRHYLPKKTILRQLDLMAQNKFNLLHWHIVDSQSFPYVSKKYPHLSERGAYSPIHTYTRATVQEIIDHARMRGIRVMAEFDTPGHMASWKGELALLTECHDEHGHLATSNIIDPTLERNYAFLRNFFDEVMSVFPEKFVHLGGDEVGFWKNCWLGNAKVRDFMTHKGFEENTTMLENYYYDRLQTIMSDIVGPDKDARTVFWEDVFQYNNPFPKAIAQIWFSASEEERTRVLQKLTAKGHEVILSSCWYLNYVNYGADWREEGAKSGQFYQCDPRAFEGSDEQKKLVLGGVAVLYGEFVDATNIESVLWPRASAVAERLWSSPKHTKDPAMAWPRLHAHRCRMVARGYRAPPINGPDFCAKEFDEP